MKLLQINERLIDKEIQDKVLKNGSVKICQRESLKNFNRYILEYFVPYDSSKDDESFL